MSEMNEGQTLPNTDQNLPVVPPVVPNPIMPATDNTLPPVTPPTETPKNNSKKGLIITGLVALSALVILGTLSLTIRNSTQEATTPSEAKTPTATPTPKTFNLEVSGIVDGEKAVTKVIKVTGTTGIPATVTIVGGEQDLVISSNGTFSADINLKNGENIILFTAVDKDENTKTLTRSVFYIEE